MWWEVITDALLDTAKLFPFLFLLYILIELLEHNTRIGKPGGALTGKWAPLAGAVTGLAPLCGFSVMAAKLYQHRHLTLGTLLSVFIATSDEGLLVLLVSDLAWLEKLLSILGLCGSKLLLGAALGYLVDLCTRKRAHVAPLPAVQTLTDAESEVDENHHEEHSRHHGEHHHGEEDEFCACEHRNGKKTALSLYMFSPFLHALKVAAFALAFNLAFGFLFFGIGGGDAGVGEERVIGFLQGAGYWYQPVVCCLVGLIPNCAASVAVAEAYVMGGIAFGGCLAGLIANAGLGYLVLLRDYKHWKTALFVVIFLFAVGIAAGYLANAVGLAIGK